MNKTRKALAKTTSLAVETIPAAFVIRGASANSNTSNASVGRRGPLAVAAAIFAVLIVAALILVGPATRAAASGEGCPNEARREEQGAAARALPDCRAYELVTPLGSPSPFVIQNSLGGPPLAETTLPGEEEPHHLPPGQKSIWPALDGDAALYQADDTNSQQDGQTNDLSRRGPDGWSWENIQPPQSRHAGFCGVNGWVGASQNLDQIAFRDGHTENEQGGNQSDPEECGHEEPRLVPGEPEESANLFLRSTTTTSFRLVNVTPPETESHDPWFDAMSADGSHVVFNSRALLTPDAPIPPDHEGCPEGEEWNELGDVYVWSDGVVHLLTVLPNGTPARGTLAGAHPFNCHQIPVQSADFTHALANDGDRVLFNSGGRFEEHPGEGNALRTAAPYVGGGLYLRQRPDAAQSALDGSGRCTELDKACTVQVDATEEGSGSSGEGQFQWANAETSKVFFTDVEQLTPDSNAETGKPDLYEYDLEKPEGQRLTDLTADSGEPVDVLGVSGASEDGSYLYFVAEGALAENENSQSSKAQPGAANLYLRHAGTTTFITALDAERGDRCDWTTYCLTSRVSSNGAFIAFNSIAPLTGYDNQPLHPEACTLLTDVAESPCMETYRYAAASGPHGELTCASCNPTGAPPAAEYAWSVIDPAEHEVGSNGGWSMQLTHNVSDSGEVFFDTMEQLLPADENDVFDAYEYDGGEGSSAQLHLISSGKDERPSNFVNASPDGANVFFFTEQPLLRSDIRADDDLYDARVGGGFVEPLIPPCEGEGCRGSAQAQPTLSTAGTGNFSGPEEGRKHPRCEKGFVLRRGHCERKHRKHRRHHHRRAGK